MWTIVKNSLLINLFFVFILIFIGYGTFRMVTQALVLYGESNSAKNKVEELQQKKEELESYIAELESRQVLEREAKKRFNLKNSGEEVVVVVPDKREQKSAVGKLSFWERAKTFLAALLSF